MPVFLRVSEGGFVSAQIAVKGTVVGAPFELHEGGECVGNVANANVGGPVDVVEGALEPGLVGANASHTIGQYAPAVIDTTSNGAEYFVFVGVAGHFEFGGDRKQGLGRDDVAQIGRQKFEGG